LRNISVILMQRYYIMDTLGDSDIAQLYNLEKRQLMKDRMEACDQSVRVMRQYMETELIDNFRKVCENCMYKAMNDLKKKYYGEDEDNHTWIGIDPSGISMEDLWKKSKELEGRYCFTQPDNLAYCVEQNTENGVRPHIHMMIRGVINQRPAYIAKRLAEYYSCAPNFIHVKHLRRKQLFAEHKNYIQGIKKEDKMSLVKLDRLDRETLGIPHFKLFS